MTRAKPRTKNAAVALSLVVLPACATVRSGEFDIPATFAQMEFPKLKGRATFDLDCPLAELTIRTLNVYVTPGGNMPSEVGVLGCGRKAVYVWGRTRADNSGPAADEAWRPNGPVTRIADALESEPRTAPAAPTPPRVQ
jgi:hypothetical protein